MRSPASSASTIALAQAPRSARAASIPPARADGGPRDTAPRRRRCCRSRRSPLWSSRNDLSGAGRPAARRPSASAVSSPESGSTPSRASRYSSSPSPSEHDRMAEPAHVREEQARPVVELNRGSQVAKLGGRLVQPGRHRVSAASSRSRRAKQQVPGHPQVHDQGPLTLEPQQQVLAAPLDRLDRPALERLDQPLRGSRPRPALVEDLHGLDPPADHLGLELAADRLDLGQLGHARVVLRRSLRPAPGAAHARRPAGAP